MLVEIEDVTLSNLWKEEGIDKKTGEKFEYWRALVNKAGEAPMQIGAQEDDALEMIPNIGAVGLATLDIDARPGYRARVRLKRFEV